MTLIYFLSMLCLLPLLILNLKVQKSLAHPASIMLLTWLTVFFLLSFSGDLYNPSDLLPLSIIILGVSLFSIASIAFSLHTKPSTAGNSGKLLLPSQSFYTSMIALYMTAPLFIYSKIDSLGSSGSFLYQIRRDSLEGTNGGFIDNTVLLANVCALFSIIRLQNERTLLGRLVLLLNILLAAVCAVMTGSKIPIITLIFSIGILLMLIKPQEQYKYLIYIVLVTIPLFYFSLFLINFAGISSFGTPERVFQFFLDYILGGVIAFSSNYPAIMSFENHQTLSTAFASLLVFIGVDSPINTIHYPYSSISSDRISNVYTVFFPFIKEFSVTGAFVVLILLGMATSAIYNSAKRSVWHIAFYSIISSSLILSIFGDPFIFGAFTTSKYIIIVFLAYVLSLIKSNRPRRRDYD